MEDITFAMLKLAAIIIIAITFIIIKMKQTISKKNIISIDEEAEKTGLELEISCTMPRLGNIKITEFTWNSNSCQVYFTDKEIILQQTVLTLNEYRNIPIFPLVICGKRQYLREKYPNNYIANIIDMEITSWNEIRLTIKMVQHSSKTIKMNMVFKSNKFENVNKLKMAIEELMKAV